MAINKIISGRNQTTSSLKNCLNYILRKDKAAKVAFIGPNLREKITPQNVYDAFIEEKQIWNKIGGRQYMHSILSFAKDEKITSEQALQIATDMVQNDIFYAGFQSVVSVHNDREHIHVHICTNTVSYIDGHKEHHNKKDIESLMRRTNQICEQLGLSVCKKGYHSEGTKIEAGDIKSFDTRKYRALCDTSKSNTLVNLAVAIENAKESDSKEKFIKKMKEHGYTTIWTDERKYITFVNDKTGKRIRNTNIAKTFNLNYLETKENLLNEFDRQTRIDRAEITANTETVQQFGNESITAGTGIDEITAGAEEIRQTATGLLKTGIKEAKRQEKATHKFKQSL
ncbi:MAG: relaxase/mobilization nuclease domain-containing protein [Sphaerochaetaceae bacterium]|nr:relaxase/mobilization nuclease domain-containing protein [Sphaerochaetaceae bacterium]